MKKLFVAILAAVTLSTSCAARNERITPSSNIVTKSFTIDRFDEIESGIVNVVYNVGPRNNTVTISAPDNVMPYISVLCENGRLKCHLRENANIRGKFDATVTVYAPTIKEFEATTSSTIEVRGKLTTHELEVNANTSGKIVFNNGVHSDSEAEFNAETSGKITLTTLVANTVELNSFTSANVSIDTITATDVEFNSETSGNVEVKTLISANADLEVDTSGDITIDTITTENLNSEADTSGSIIIKAGTITTGNYQADTNGRVRINARTTTADATADTNGNVSCKAVELTKRTSSGGRVHQL